MVRTKELNISVHVMKRICERNTGAVNILKKTLKALGELLFEKSSQALTFRSCLCRVSTIQPHPNLLLFKISPQPQSPL